MATELDPLLKEIDETLRGLVFVPRISLGSLVLQPGFWERCHLVTPNWRDEIHPFIFVDGFVGASKWNSWKVYADAIEHELSLWLGFALGGASWVEHAWCMLDGRIVETTSPMRIYFGAEVRADELVQFGEKYGKHSLKDRPNLRVATFVDGWRDHIPYIPSEHWDGIGRERDFETGQIKQGLGR